MGTTLNSFCDFNKNFCNFNKNFCNFNIYFTCVFLLQALFFNVYKWQKIVDAYNSFPEQHRCEIDGWISQFPHASDIVKADLSRCRLKRVNNFLHADFNIKQSKLWIKDPNRRRDLCVLIEKVLSI